VNSFVPNRPNLTFKSFYLTD